jgi:hypothetical protein
MTAPEMVKELEDIDAMFVQTAAGVEHAGDRIVLRDVSAATLFFSDRPRRVVGHLGTAEFVDLWDAGEDSFSTDPPNAVLAFVGQGDKTPQDVVLEISDPSIRGEELSYTAKVLEGTLPAWVEGCTLFIDPFGRPLTPISVAGMRRRTRRRTRRRVAVAAR